MTGLRKLAAQKRIAADRDALDAAWRIHGAVTDWTGKVDTKASFCLAIESAAMVATVNLTANGRLFDAVVSLPEKSLFYAGVTLLSIAILCAANVVVPRLRRFKTKKEWSENFIYFGHLRHWDARALEAYMRNSQMLPVLTTQLVNMSKIAWRKHVMVQASLILGLAGAASLGWCSLLLQ